MAESVHKQRCFGVNLLKTRTYVQSIDVKGLFKVV